MIPRDDTPGALFTAAEASMLEHTVLGRQRLEEQYADLEHQTASSTLGMWVFLGTEVLFFGTLFVALGVYRYLYGEAFEKASSRLNWMIGGGNTLVLLTSSYTIVMAVYQARVGERKAAVRYLLITAALGFCFLGLKGLEYYLDFVEQLVPRFRFDPGEWVDRDGLTWEQVPQVELFLCFYWFMTAFHALHVTIGIVAVLVIARLTWTHDFTGDYYAPVEVLALYWHFVDIVWIFLLPMLYLQGTHHGVF